jgi:sigma-B regulation protein RsbU (phosphoserine phosphatase)
MHLNRPQSHRGRRWFLELICVFAAYILAGEVGLSVPFPSGTVSPVWPAAGVALAAILLFGYRIWPAIAMAAFTVNYFTGIPHLAAAGTAFGSTVGPLCGAWLLRKLPDFRPSLTRLRDVLLLSFCGAICGTVVSATVGTGVLALADGNAWSGFAPEWLKWWWGDATGVLIVTPLALTFTGLMAVRDKRRRLELVCLLLGTIASASLIFGHRLGSMHAGVFAFGVFPFVLWGAIRFEVAGSAIVSFLSSAIAVWGTAHGFGLVIYGTVEQNAMLLQAFIVVTSISGVVLAAVIAERAELIRKQSTLQALEHSEKNYRGIVETAYEGIWKLNADLETTLVNSRMAELLGYTVQEMLGRPLFDFMFETDIEQKKSEMARRQGVSEQIETCYRGKDGKALWARVTTSPIIGVDGSFEGALAMVSDMTEQMRAESERRRSQEMISLLSRAVEQTADSVVITDRYGTIEYVNPAFEVITGYERQEVVGKTPGILKSSLHDKEFYNRLWDQILQGEDFHGTIVDRKKSGELYWAEQTISPIKGSDGVISHFVSVCKDVTALRKEQERELQLQMARNVQQRFYTGAMTCAAGFDIASAIYPAKEACGDYLDVFSMPDGRTCIGIGDVSGHGLDSAMVMALTRAYVRAFTQVEADVARILCRVNHMLLADLEDARFVTMLLVCLDGTNGCLSYAGAGHVSGFLMKVSGEIDHALESSGPPLGLFPDSNFVTSTIPLTSQHLMILLTDGTTEMATSGDVEFGAGGVLEYVRAHRQDSTIDLVNGIYRAARSFAGDHPQQDDATGVIVRVA